MKESAAMDEGSVRIFATHTWLEAEIVKGRLEAEEIPVRLEGEHEGPYPVGPAELFVPEAFEKQARRVLADIEQGSFDVQDEETPPE
jgi:hypothetical protein